MSILRSFTALNRSVPLSSKSRFLRFYGMTSRWSPKEKERSNPGRSISILTIGVELIGIVDPVLFVLFTLVLNLTRFFARSEMFLRGGCVVWRRNRTAGPSTSPLAINAARGSAQDGTFLVDSLI